MLIKININKINYGGIATNTTLLIPLFNFTLFNFTIKILIDKVQLYPWIIKPKLLSFSPNSKFESSQIDFEFDGDQIRRHWRVLRTALARSPADLTALTNSPTKLKNSTSSGEQDDLSLSPPLRNNDGGYEPWFASREAQSEGALPSTK